MIENYVILNLTVLAFMLCMFLSLRHQFHMLQQNSYMTGRYLKWYWDNRAAEISPWWTLPMLSCLFLAFGLVPFMVFFWAACAAAFYFTRSKKKEKKKFVVTGRVKRLYGVAIILLGVLWLLIGYALMHSPPKMLYIYFLILAGILSFKFLFVCLDLLILYPYEKLSATWYIKDAKKRIESLPDLTVIGITGSYGKTSSKYILQRILSEKFNVLMTPESYNTTLGVVRTVREQLNASHQIFIAEMGARKRGDVREICEIVKPKYGILTSIGPCHLETFGTMEAVASTKFELADAIPRDGLIFLNYDNPRVKGKDSYKNSCSYGTASGLSFWATDISYVAGGLSFVLNSKEGLHLRLKTSLLGIHNVLNITAAAGLALKLGVSPEDVSVAVSQLRAVPHRLELKIGGGYTVIDDAYNSNPEGAEEALNVLSRFEGKRILITPGMVEMGDSGYELNRKFGMHAATCCDEVIVVGRLNGEAIVNGLLEAGYSKDKIHMTKSLDAGLKVLAKIADETSVVLFENDLPDSLENK